MKTNWKKLPTGVYTRTVNGRVEVKTASERQYRSNQGRSTRKQVVNQKMMYWSLIGLAISILIIIITL